MTKQEARQILASWLESSKGTEEQLGYIDGWFFKEDEEAFDIAIEALYKPTSDDLIIKGAKGIKDGLFNIQNGELFQYKAKGGTVRAYPIVEALQDDWIPVSERLPEEDKEVLVTVYFKGLDIETPTGWVDHIKPSTYVETASHMDGEWYSVSDEYKVARNRHRVIAWRPLPEPYKESEE